MLFTLNCRGQGVLPILVGAGLMSIVMVSSMAMLKSQGVASRQLAARGGISDLSHALDTLFGSPRCATTGSLAAALAPAIRAYSNGGSPATVTVSGSTYDVDLDTFTFASGQVAVTTLANAGMSSTLLPYAIQDIRMTALGGEGPDGTGFRFPFQMEVILSHPSGPPPMPLKKFVTLYTDATRTVTGACSLPGALAPMRTWVDVSGVRSLNTVYRNETDHEIEISVSTYSGATGMRCAVGIFVNQVHTGTNFVNNAVGAALCNAKATVPPGAEYRAEGVDYYSSWSELR